MLKIIHQTEYKQSDKTDKWLMALGPNVALILARRLRRRTIRRRTNIKATLGQLVWS